MAHQKAPTSETTSELGKRVAVQGNGWSALLLVASLLRGREAGSREIVWIPGMSPYLAPVTPMLAAGGAPLFVKALGSEWGIEVGDIQRGSFLREYRNKAFRESLWAKAPSLEARVQAIEESLWEPERNWALPFEARFAERDLIEVETQLRAALVAHAGEAGSPLSIREKVSLTQIEFPKDAASPGLSLTLSDGTALTVDNFLFADRWSEIAPIKGFPRPLAFLRNREAVGILQASFEHSQPVGQGVDEVFCIGLPKENGEEQERKVWGSFRRDGMASTWSVALSTGEAEDNHLIGKKLRRIKTALERTFIGQWVGEDIVNLPSDDVPAPVADEGEAGFSPDFLAMLRERRKRMETKVEVQSLMNLVKSEQVRFGEFCLFSDGEPVRQPVDVKAAPGVWFFTDGYGASNATLQALEFARMHGLLPAGWSERAEAEAGAVDFAQPEGLSRELEGAAGRDEVVHQESDAHGS